MSARGLFSPARRWISSWSTTSWPGPRASRPSPRSRRRRGARGKHRPDLRLFGGDPHFRRGGAHVGIDVLLELHEVLLEHVDELARGLIELELVLPGLLRIEQVWLDAAKLGRHPEAEIRIGAEFRVFQRAVERRGEQRARYLDRH